MSIPSNYPTLLTTQLIPWEKNRRSISKENYDLLKEKLEKKRQFKPLFVTPADTDVVPVQYIVLAGNMRLKAYKELGVPEVWVSLLEFSQDEQGLWKVTRDGVEEIERFQTKEDAMLDWSLSENEEFGKYDWDEFANDYDGYSLDWSRYLVSGIMPTSIKGQLKDFLMTDEIEEDEPPAISDEPASSELGKVYQLGRHRLMCGDAMNIEHIKQLTENKMIDLLLTDPPYGIKIVGKDGNIGGGTTQIKVNTYRPIINDDVDLEVSTLLPFSKYSIIWGGNYLAYKLPKGGRWIVWDKDRNDGLSFSDCELAWTNIEGVVVKKYTIRWDGYSREGEQKEALHPTMKSLKLMANIIRDYTEEDATVSDLFGGSGSTLIACEQTNRQCYMMELDPKYCDVIRKRYAKFIGEEDRWEEITPELEGGE